jgi:hypothetical protein
MLEMDFVGQYFPGLKKSLYVERTLQLASQPLPRLTGYLNANLWP